jgi:hypothetical protein
MCMHAQKRKCCAAYCFRFGLLSLLCDLVLQDEGNSNNAVIDWTRGQSGLAGVIVFDRTFHCSEQTSATNSAAVTAR